MIRFSLTCDNAHAFDGWFSSSMDFDSQQERGLVACPSCGSAAVTKALMAPQVATGRDRDRAKDTMRREMVSAMRDLREKVTQNADNVGKQFSEEARKIHYRETPARAIYGEATAPQVKELLDEGVTIAPLPPVPDDAN